MPITNLLKAKSEFRKKGVALMADKQKTGAGGSWKFASEDNLIKTIQQPLIECGLELVTTLQYITELGIDTVEVALYHIESGEAIVSTASLPPVSPKNDRNGNPLYLDAEIERGKQFGYLSRTLSIRILGLSDIDPEDTRNVPEDMTKEPVDTQKEMNIIKESIDISDKDMVYAAKKQILSLYSLEVDIVKKEVLKAYGLELKGILEKLNEPN